MRKSAIVSFPERDRWGLPEGYVRVTGGPGGECLLIRCGEKACVLYDTGMYYCGPETIENIKRKTREGIRTNKVPGKASNFCASGRKN